MDAATWIALTPHTAHVLRGAGAEALLLEEASAENVAGKRLVIAPSAARGEGAVRAAVRRLQTLGGDVRVVETVALSGALDVADLVEQHAAEGRRADLATIAEGAQRVPVAPTRDNAPSGLVVLDVGTFLAEPIPPRKPILAPIILEQSLTMIHAWRGAGKTHVALGIAYAVASGGRFLRWQADEPRKVVYLDGEMPGAALQERLAAIVKASDCEPPAGFLRLATPDKQPHAMPDLATLEGQAAVDVGIESDTALIIVDNLSCLARRGGAENEAESWLTVADWALMQRARGRSILFIHHSGKNGQQRGTSKREDLLDTVLALTQPRDYNPANGAVFEVHFEKARGLYGEDVAPFEAKLTMGNRGVQQWAMRAAEDSTFERVIELYGLGLKQNDIAQELGIDKSNVCRALKKAESAGRIVRREGGK